MNVHKNAKQTPLGREQMVLRVLRGQTLVRAPNGRFVDQRADNRNA
ncbi:MAG: hypothetical protein AAGC95_07345 [Pseudomonadota bacterium]